MPPDPFDAGLSAARTAVDDIGVWVAIWLYRAEPDAFARRCASDAIDAIDTGLAALHRIRGQLICEVREADDAAAARADQLLAKLREGPPDTAAARPPSRATTTHADPPPDQEAKS